MLLSAPKYFKLKETAKGTVLVERGVLVKEDESAKYANVRQFYFNDRGDNGVLKCLTGGQLAYIVDQHDLHDKSKEVKITYGGMETIENGKFAGTQSHQFIVELVNDAPAVAPQSEKAATTNTSSDDLE